MCCLQLLACGNAVTCTETAWEDSATPPASSTKAPVSQASTPASDEARSPWSQADPHSGVPRRTALAASA